MSHPLERELQTHARALRRLAHSLVGDQHADDLVQDTALSALRQTTRPESLRSWLFAVLRRLASKHARSERRRLSREAAAPPPAPEPAPDRAAERKDTLQQLTAALVALPEPYQRTLLLRYFEELTPTAIAARTLVPVATVKTRLARGLQLLRERLDAGKEESDWRAALGALLGLRRGGPLAAATGVMLMGTGAKLWLGGVGAAVAVAAAWWCLQSPAPAGQTTAGLRGASLPTVSADMQTPAVAAMQQRAQLEIATAAPPPEPASTMRGRVVDEDGQPLTAAELNVEITRRTEAGGWRQAGEQAATTGIDGAFSLPCAAMPNDRLHLRVRRDGCCAVSSWWDMAADGLDLGDIVLPAAITVRGRVVDEKGQPQAGAELRIYRDPMQGHHRIGPSDNSSATSLDDGSFCAGAPLASGHGWLTVENRSLLRGTPT